MRYRSWKIKRPDEAKAKQLCAALGLPLLASRVLTARGIDTPEAAGALLDGTAFSDSFLLKDMDKAVQRIHAAIDGDEKIVVFGDYDVDGVTSTALLFSHLSSMGANVRCMLPSRDGDGYGLSRGAVEKLARNGYKLVITVDNGVSAAEEIAFAVEQGIDVIVTDHHLPPAKLPPALAVVDPARSDDESPFKFLSGVGVAFKLACALEDCPPEEMLDFYADLVAVGTVADVVPLVGENRAAVRYGLQLMNQQARPGLDALIRAAGLDKKPLAAENIAFGIAPRLNAAGRMEDATQALRLLLTEGEDQADQLAAHLCDANTARQQAEQTIMEEVRAQLERNPALLADRVLVLWGQDYHQGVIGIAASRLVEKYGRPAILISVADGEGKGSGRSVKGFDLHEALSACADCFVRYGGHAMAAGLSILPERMEEFRRRINEWAGQHHPVMPCPPLEVDAPVRLDQLSVEDVQALDLLEPFGAGNPSPLFLLEQVTVDGAYPVGDGRHCRLRLRQGNRGLYAVWFGQSAQQLPYPPGSLVDAVVALSVYEGKNGPQLSGRIKEIRPAGLSEAHVQQAALFEGYRAGKTLTAQEKALLCPARSDTVAVYQQIRAGGVNAQDLRGLFARLGQIEPGRILASLAALEELSLVGTSEADGTLRPLPSKEKKDLHSARVLAALEG